MQLLLSVLAGGADAPTTLSLEELAQLLRACHFALAEKLLDSFKEYLSPGILRLGADQVCTWLLQLSRLAEPFTCSASYRSTANVWQTTPEQCPEF